MRREFSKKTKVEAFKRANGHCEMCTAKLHVGHFQYDHRIADSLGGEPTLENCIVACSACHSTKTRTSDVPLAAKSKRREAKFIGAHRSSRPMPGSRSSAFKIRMDGSVVRRDA